MYNIFIFCGGKCGGTTLANTFYKNGYETLHLHSFKCLGFYNHKENKKLNTLSNITDILEKSSNNFEDIYIIDSYRTPIERKISSFFEHIKETIPDYKTKSMDELINYFNCNLLYGTEEYHSINLILDYYNIPLFKKFDFEKKYNIVKQDNKIFIKLLFKDIDNWDEILSGIFEKKIIINEENLSSKKDINSLYTKFKKEYKIPKSYIRDKLINDQEFKIYNSEIEQQKYIEEWLKKSY